MKSSRIFRAIRVICFGMMFATTAQAQGVLLTVVAQDTRREYSLEDLQALPATVIETTTIWTEGMQRFEGVLLKTLLETLGVTTGVIEATAINDYSVAIPVSDAAPDGPIIAYFANGVPMSRRGKGPLWIIYPFDSDRLYQTESIYSRSIWQLDRLVIK